MTSEAANGLSQWTPSLRSEGDRFTLLLPSASLLPEIVRFLVAKGVDVYEITPQRVSLEERFLQIVGSDGGAYDGRLDHGPA